MDWDPRDDAWLAGFADGEGCFLINTRAHGEARYCYPRFVLNLRADDLPILRTLQGAFGGRLVFERRGGHGRYFWYVSTKAAMAGLVAYFDHFPLRAKKAADYAVWREAVGIYLAHGGRRASEELGVLREALLAVRVYDADAVVAEAQRATAEAVRGC